jgi:hypothetical protein
MSPQQDEFEAMCRGFGDPSIVKDPRFATTPMRARNAPALRELIEPLAAQQNTDECVARMRAEGTPIGKVNEHDDVLTDPQVVHSESIAEVDHGKLGRVRLARGAARFGTGPRPTPAMAAELGEHGRQVLESLGYDAQRGLFIDSVRVSGAVTSPHGTVALLNWNRPAPNRAGLVDARWGVPLDTLVRTRAMRLDPIVPVRQDSSAGRYVLRAARPGDTLVYGDTLLLVVPPAMRARAVAGDTVTVQRRLTPVWPRETVGGRGVLLIDSVVGADVDKEGNAGFQGLNPRTAAGIARVGTSQRLLLAVIDGRQPGYSVGMTLRQTAELLQSLGAQRAINLDGGGSSAMIVRDNATGALRVRNKPSDPTGERPVGNALAVLGSCIGR